MFGAAKVLEVLQPINLDRSIQDEFLRVGSTPKGRAGHGTYRQGDFEERFESGSLGDNG
jgi:hypothetical protein